MSSSGIKGIKGSAHSKGTPPINTPQSPDTEMTNTQIPYIKIKDNAKLLPTYATALLRSPDEALPAEDLDAVQLELETLLSNVALRYRVLKTEYDSIDKDERRRNKHAGGTDHKPPHSPASASLPSGKRKREDTGNTRKLKHSSTTTKPKHSKHSPSAIHTDDSMDYTPVVGSHSVGHHREHQQKASMPKNDTPNKFWLSVEPYCMPVTNEDVRLLDDLLDRYSGPLVPPIPELGPHYSGVWAAEDMKDVQMASNPNFHSNRLKQQNSAVNNMLKKADSITEKCVMGPLTQRLVSALMEEQLIQTPSDLVSAGMAESSNSSSENTQSSSQMHFRSLSMLRNCIDIEKRVKKELIEQGILDMEDFPNEHEDEVLAEINRVVAELSALADHNKTALQRLAGAAHEEMKRLDIKRKLDAIDQEILEVYKRTVQNKNKRKFLTVEEEEEIYRLTAEQMSLSEELDRVQENCYFYD